MKFCSENAKDIQKYFAGSYMKFPSLAGEALHQIDHVNSDSIKGKTLNPDGEVVPFVFHLYPESAAAAPEIEFILPKKSFFNTPEGAHLLERIPARQYRKGVCGENTTISRLYATEWKQVGLNFQLLAQYVGKQTFQKFGPAPTSYAVSRRMAVGSNGALFVDRTQIGHIDYHSQIIYVTQPIFIPEVERLVRQNTQSYKVEEGIKTGGKKAKKVSNKYSIDDEGNIVENVEE